MALDYSMILNRPNVGQQLMQGMQLAQQQQALDMEAQRAQRLAEQEAQQAQRAAEFRSAWAKAGNVQERAALAGQFPEMLDTIKSAVGMDQELKTQAIGEIGMQMTALANDPAAVEAYVKQNADVLSSLGPAFDPNRIIQQAQTNPQALAQTADMITMAALGPEKYQDIVGQREQRNLQERQFVETQQQNQFSRGIQQAELGLRQQANEIARLGRQEALIDRQLARETNDLKRQELEAKLDAARSERERAQQTRQIEGEAALSTAQIALDTINRLESAPGLSYAVGMKSPLAYIPGTEASDAVALTENLQSQVFLDQVARMKGTGSLTEAEGRKLEVALGSLDRDQSEEQFRRNLGIIKGVFSDSLGRIQREYGIQPSAQQTQPGAPAVGSVVDGYRFKGGDPADQNNWERM